MMLGDDEPTDPLVDPFASIPNDPLNGFHNQDGYETDSSGSEECTLSSYINKIPPSLTITPSPIAGLQVHKIPAFTNSLTITKIEDKKYNKSASYEGYKQNGFSNDENGYGTYQPKRRGRKKGSKNKFKKGIPIETWEKCGMQLNNGLVITKIGNNKRNFVESDLSMILNGKDQYMQPQEEVKTKRKYTKKMKLDEDIYENIYTHDSYVQEDLIPQVPVAPHIDLASRLTIDIDPSEYFPDEPFPKDKVYRKRKRAGRATDPQGQQQQQFHCDICKKGFKCVKGVQAHKSAKHGIEDLGAYYPCEICQEVFTLKRDLSYHTATHQNDQGRMPCPEHGCDISETDIQALIKHKSKFHPHLGTLGRSWFHTWGER